MPEVSDVSLTFVGGQDASKSPHLVPEDAYWAGVNLTTQDGNLRPRWGLWKRQPSFPAGGVNRKNSTLKAFKDIFKGGKFQAVAPHIVGPDTFAVFVVSGQIFFVNRKTLQVQHIPLEGESLNPRAPRINWSQAGKYLVFADFPARPVIIEGVTARRADPDKDEVPVCTLLGYTQNRLGIANAGNEFTFGDPAGSTATPNAPITFSEVIQPNTGFTGQVFQLGTAYANEQITAITFLQVSDQSTEIGPTLIATKKAIYSYQTQTPRSSWAAGQFGTNFVYNAGIAGPRAVDHLNSDVIFVSADGMVRSAAMSRDEQNKWSKTPISKEVRNWLKVNDSELLGYTFVSYYNNKVFIGANPYRTSALGIDEERLPDYAHGGFVVLELDNISTLSKESQPVWAGLWTGVRPMDMVTFDDGAWVISKDGGSNEIYEFTPETTYDTDGEHIRYIKSKLYTREYDFQQALFQDKKLHSLDLKLQKVRGDFSVKVRYKPDHMEKFIDWREFKHTAFWRNCRKPFFFQGLSPQSFMNVNLGSPNHKPGCDPVTLTPDVTFRTVQLELTLEGVYWELEALRVKAQMDPQSENINSCPTNYKSVPVPAQCSDDWTYGEFGPCPQRQT